MPNCLICNKEFPKKIQTNSKKEKKFCSLKCFHLSYKNGITKNRLLSSTPIILSEVEKAYIIGLLDGEGCITYGKEKNKINVSIIIGMTHQKTIKWLVDKIKDAKFRIRENDNCKDGFKREELYIFHLTRQRTILDLLKLLLPYSITKKSQIEKAIKFIHNNKKL